MPLGVKRTFQSNLTDVYDDDIEVVGTRRTEGDDEYIWCSGVASTIIGAAVTIDHVYATVLLDDSTGGSSKRIGVAMAAIVAGKFGWYQISGVGTVMAEASSNKNVPLYTDAVAGVVTSSTDGTRVDGIFLTAIVGGSDALEGCILMYPHTNFTIV